MDIIELWWLGLAIFALVVVVVAVLLGLIIAAAKRIDRHAAAIWVAGKQIAGNTVPIWMLEKTNRQLETLADSSRAMEQSASAMTEALQALARTSKGGR